MGGLAVVALASGCTRGPPEAPPPSRTLRQMAEEVGADVVDLLRRGHVPGRSGEILLVPRPRNVVVRRGMWTPGGPPPADTSHSTPWDYHQRVPIILYGPGHIRQGARPQRSVDLADLAPTFAELMRFEFPAPDGDVLEEALLPPTERRGVPRVIVLVVYDGGGWNLLQQWPHAWPFTRRLAGQGTTYTNATAGSSPSVTAAIHPTMGTGAYPATHGLPDNTVRLPGGSLGDAYRGRAHPGLLEVETLADAWDRARGNRPWAGLVATESWHLGMLGHGAELAGGDRDVAVLWNRGEMRFSTNPDFYALPSYLPSPQDLVRRLRRLDAEDGAPDGRWRDNSLEDEDVVPGTPAFVAHQREALLEIVRREPIGRDGLTDLLFVELKSTDRGAHVWNLVGDEEQLVLRAQDDLLRDLARILDDRVGSGRYVIGVTADHGLTALPEQVGGLWVHPQAIRVRVNQYFGTDLVEKVTPAAVFLDADAAAEAGVRVADVARVIGDLRYGEGLPAGFDVSEIAEDVLRERVIAAALPGSWVARLSKEQVRALGEGAYPEGDLTGPVEIDAL